MTAATTLRERLVQRRGASAGTLWWSGCAAGIAVAIALPSVITGQYAQGVLVTTLIFVILTAGYNLFTGFTGYLSLSHPAFFGVGAYAAALLNTKAGTGFWVDVAAAIAAASMFALVLGLIVFPRVDGFPFAVVTLGLTVMTYVVAGNWFGLTRGPLGVPNVAPPIVSSPLGGDPVVVLSPQQFYYLFLPFAVVAIVLVRLVTASRGGRNLAAIRENERLLGALGANTLKHKLVTFVIGAGMCGLAGALYAHYVTVVSPEVMWIFWIVTPLAMVVIGGAGFIGGVLVATIALVVIPESLHFASDKQQLLYGIVLVLAALFIPRGIGGQLHEWRYRWTHRHRSSQ